MAIPQLQIPQLGAVSGGIDWSPLADLGKVYREAQNRQSLSDLGKGIADGTIDYRQAASRAAEMGNPDGVFKFLALAEAKDKQGEELKASQDFARLFAAPAGGGGAATVPNSAPTMSLSSIGRPASASSNKIYEPNEPSPLDPPDGADRDRLARTVIAEAGNQGPVGMNAVASVVRNRAVNGGFGGDTPSGVVTARSQFEPWNTVEGRKRMATIDPNGPEYTAAVRAIDSAYAGNDPTNGATHFYSPSAQAALGRKPPSWDDGTGRDIGGHRYFGGAPADPGQAPYQVAGSPVAARGAAAAAPEPGPAASQQSSPANGLPEISIPQLIGAISNPRLPSAQREVAGMLLKRALDNSKPNEKIQVLQQLKQDSGFQGSLLDLEMQLRRAGKTDVTIDQRGENEEAKAAGKAAGERRATMFASAGAASKTLQNLSRTEALLNQVGQGKLSPATMKVSAWAKALGLNDDVATSLGLDPKGVGSAQALQSLVNESVIGKIGQGGFPANNFSDADREFITRIFPNLGDDPQANKIRIEGARRVANLDLQRARDYQAWKAEPANKGKGFEDFETDWSDRIAKQDVFGDLRREAEKISGAPRGDVGGTLNNPGRAPRQQQQQPSRTRQGVNWSLE